MIASNEHPPTLQVFLGERIVFASDGRWLHPLFDLEEFLKGSDYAPERLVARDRIVGKAAALLFARMGIRTVHAGILSRLAEEVLKQRGIEHRFDTRVERIDCATEELLANIDDSESAYLLLAERARAAGAGQKAVSRQPKISVHTSDKP